MKGVAYDTGERPSDVAVGDFKTEISLALERHARSEIHAPKDAEVHAPLVHLFHTKISGSRTGIGDS